MSETTVETDHLADLTDAQREAVLHNTGAALVVAGAGSGKTRVITRRIVHLLRSGVRSSRILGLTFTNKAAGEMRERVEEMVPEAKVWLGTFHSFAAKILRRNCQKLNIDKDFHICDEDDRKKLIRDCLKSLGVEVNKAQVAVASNTISEAKNNLLHSGRFPLYARHHQFTAGLVYQRYQWSLRQNSQLDFDDLLNLLVVALRQDEGLRAQLDDTFRYILVDEVQDTNTPQYEILRMLTRDTPNVVAVGDPDQCFPADTQVLTKRGEKRIADIRVGDVVLSAGGWGDVTESVVENVLEKQYNNTLVKLTLSDGTIISGTPSHMCFGRLEVDPDRHYVYLMYRKNYGYRIGTTRGVRMGSSMNNGLRVRCAQEHADCMWVLMTCDNVADARMYEQFLSVQFGIPTMVFFVAGRESLAVTQEHVNNLFHWIDTESNAKKLLVAMGLSIDHPHHHAGGSVKRSISRRKVHLTMFGDNRVAKRDATRWRKHTVQLNTSGEDLRAKLADDGHAVRAGNRNTWRVAKLIANYDQAEEYMNLFSNYPEFSSIRQAKLTGTGYFDFLPMGSLVVGMEVPVVRGWSVVPMRIVSIDRCEHSGPVYDLNVADVRNYAANGMIVHNCLYSWRGANIGNILNFQTDYPGCKLVKLETNYRSTPQILRVADAIIHRNKDRIEKVLIPERADGEPVELHGHEVPASEAKWIAEDIEFGVGRGRQYADHAVLVRVHRLTWDVEQALLRRNIPYKIHGGLGFLGRKEVKDILAYCRLAVAPADPLAFVRVVNEPNRGAGKVTLDRLLEWAEAHASTPLVACRQADNITGISRRASEALRKFATTMNELSDLLGRPTELVAAAVQKTGYRDALIAEQTAESLERVESIDRLATLAVQFAADHPNGTMAEFLERMALGEEEEDTEGGETPERVSIMTMHAAKGLEFPVVYLPGLENGILPGNRTLQSQDEGEKEEDRRVFFVGITRAQDRLVISYCNRRIDGGKFEYSLPSAFLDELGNSVQHDRWFR